MKFWSNEFKLWRVAALFVVLVLMAIGSAMVYHRIAYWYEYKVHYGMTMDQVAGILGQPEAVRGDKKDSDWWYFTSDREPLVLSFRDGRLDYGVYGGNAMGNWIRVERDRVHNNEKPQARALR